MNMNVELPVITTKVSIRLNKFSCDTKPKQIRQVGFLKKPSLAVYHF